VATKAIPPQTAVDEPTSGTPVTLEHKSVAAAGVGSGAIPTSDPYEFDIIASVTGVKDLVDDVVVPGAYAATLARRTPKVIKDHDWKQRLGKVLTIKELMPGDAALPVRTPRGDPWPAGAGALMAKVRLFQSQAGRDAAERWREYGPEQEFSVGYAAKRARQETKSGARYLLEMDLYEISDVLFGAMPLAGALPEPLSTKVLTGAQADATDAEDDEPAAKPKADLPQITSPTALRAAIAQCEKTPSPELKAHIVARAKAMSLSFMVPKGWSKPAGEGKDVSDAADETKAGGASNRPWSDFSAADYSPEQWRRACLIDTGQGDPGSKDRYKLPVREPSGTLNRNGVHAAASALAGGRGGVQADPGQKRKAARALVRFYGTLGEDPPESLTSLAGQGKDDSSTSVDDVVEGLLDVELESAAFDIEPQLGEPGELESKWVAALGAMPPEVFGLEGKYDTSPVGEPGGRQNWADRAGGLPPFLRAVAHALIRERGKSEGNAIQIAIGRIKRWAAGEGNVTAKTRAKAAAVVAWWEAHTGAHKGLDGHDGPAAEWDPSIEVGPDAGHLAPAGRQEIQLDTKQIPYVAGSWEERRNLLDEAVRRFFLGDNDGRDQPDDVPRRYVCIDATFDDWLVASLYSGNGGPGESYRLDYEIADGLVMLGDPTPAKLAVTVAPDDDDGSGSGVDYGTAMTMAGMDSAMAGAKLIAASFEGKAGRVLSGTNMTRIASAVEALVAVLRSAGVPLDADGEQTEPTEPAERVETPGDTTSPMQAKEMPSPASLVAAAMRLRAASAGL
jgi:HK97 family phage prohead protease